MVNRLFLVALLTLVYNAGAQTKDIGIKIDYIDKSVDPKKDFFKFANGIWLKTFQIPPSESGFASFNEIKDRNEANLKAIVEKVSSEKGLIAGSNKQKIGDFFKLAMDSIKREKDGIKPLASDFSEIDKISNKNELLKTMAAFHKKGINTGFAFDIGAYK